MGLPGSLQLANTANWIRLARLTSCPWLWQLLAISITWARRNAVAKGLQLSDFYFSPTFRESQYRRRNIVARFLRTSATFRKKNSGFRSSPTVSDITYAKPDHWLRLSLCTVDALGTNSLQRWGRRQTLDHLAYDVNRRTATTPSF